MAEATTMSDFADWTPPDTDELERLEALVERQLKAPDRPQLKLLGHGEVTIAIAHPSESPRWACKRMPPVARRARAEAYARHIERYVQALWDAGAAVLPSACRIVRTHSGRFALYVIQPIVPAAGLAPNVLRARVPSADDTLLSAIFDSICKASGPRLGVDGQLANWALVGDHPTQIDVTTPFTRDERGRPELDTATVVAPYPGALRWVLKRWVVPDLLIKYHDPRSILLDFTANLIREDMQDWIPAAIAAANRRTSPALTIDEVRAYYHEDAKLWEAIYQVKKFYRDWLRATGRTYQFLLQPPTTRDPMAAREVRS